MCFLIPIEIEMQPARSCNCSSKKGDGKTSQKSAQVRPEPQPGTHHPFPVLKETQEQPVAVS